MSVILPFITKKPQAMADAVPHSPPAELYGELGVKPFAPALKPESIVAAAPSAQ